MFYSLQLSRLHSCSNLYLYSNQNTPAISRETEASVEPVWVKQKCQQTGIPVEQEIVLLESVIEGHSNDEVFEEKTFLTERCDSRKARLLTEDKDDTYFSDMDSDHYHKTADDKPNFEDIKQSSTGSRNPQNKILFPCQPRTGTKQRKMHELSECSKYEEMVDVFRQLIVKNLNVRKILPHLPFIEDQEELSAVQNISRTDAVNRLLNELKACKEVWKWHKFIAALSVCGYEYIVQNIRGYRFINHFYQVDYLKTLIPKLSKMLQPMELLASLYAEDVISESDGEEIEREYHNRGNIASAIVMLNRIPKKHSKWYTKFITVLRQEGFDDIAEMLDIPNLTQVIKTKEKANFPEIPANSSIAKVLSSQTDVKEPSEPVREKIHRGPRPTMQLPPLPIAQIINQNTHDYRTDRNSTDLIDYDDINDEGSEESLTHTDIPSMGIQEVHGDVEEVNSNLKIPPLATCPHVIIDKTRIMTSNEDNFYYRGNRPPIPLPPRSITQTIPPKTDSYRTNLFSIDNNINFEEPEESWRHTNIQSVDNQAVYDDVEDVNSSSNMSSMAFRDYCFKPCKEDKFSTLKQEIEDMEMKVIDLDEEVKLLDSKKGLQSIINGKLKRKRDLLLDIAANESQKQALESPLDQGETKQT